MSPVTREAVIDEAAHERGLRRAGQKASCSGARFVIDEAAHERGLRQRALDERQPRDRVVIDEAAHERGLRLVGENRVPDTLPGHR